MCGEADDYPENAARLRRETGLCSDVDRRFLLAPLDSSRALLDSAFFVIGDLTSQQSQVREITAIAGCTTPTSPVSRETLRQLDEAAGLTKRLSPPKPSAERKPPPFPARALGADHE